MCSFRLKKISILTTTFIALFLSGCATIEGTLIAPEIQTPTVPEKDTLDLDLSIAPGRSATLFNDASARPPTYSTDFDGVDSKGGALTGSLMYGISKSVSIGTGLLGSNALVDGFWAGGKMQLIGPSGLVDSSRFYFSVYGRAGFLNQFMDKSGDHKGEFGPGGYPWKAERNGNFINGGASIGFKVMPGLIPFVGIGSGTSKIQARVEQTAANGDAGGTYTQSFRGTLKTWGGGIQFFEEKFRLSVGAQRMKTTVGTYSVQESVALLNLEFRINDNRKKAASSDTETTDGT